MPKTRVAAERVVAEGAAAVVLEGTPVTAGRGILDLLKNCQQCARGVSLCVCAYLEDPPGLTSGLALCLSKRYDRPDFNFMMFVEECRGRKKERVENREWSRREN